MSEFDAKANPQAGRSIAHDFGCTHNPCRCQNEISEADRRIIEQYARDHGALGWQDETLDHGPILRRVMRVLIAAVDAWRGERRDWRQGAKW